MTAASDGEHRVSIQDPVAKSAAELAVNVASVSIERRNPVRNVSLQRSLATASGGRSYELTTAEQFLKDFYPPRMRETTVEILPLWNTWLTFGVLVTLLMAEWLIRKRVHLP